MGTAAVSDSFAGLFLTLSCLAQPKYEGRFLVLLQLDMPHFVDTPGRPDLF